MLRKVERDLERVLAAQPLSDEPCTECDYP